MFFRSHNAKQTLISGIGYDSLNGLYFKGIPTENKKFPLLPILDSEKIIENRSEEADFSIEGAALSLLIDDDPDAVWGGIAFAKDNIDIDLNVYLEDKTDEGVQELVVVELTVNDIRILKVLAPYIK